MVKRNGTESMSLVKSVGLGAGICLLLSLVGCLLLSWLLNGQKMEMEAMKYGVMAVTFLASAFGSFAAKKMTGEKNLLTCACVGALYFLLLLGSGALFYDGSIRGAGETVLLVLGASLAVAFVGNGRKTKRKTRVYKG